MESSKLGPATGVWLPAGGRYLGDQAIPNLVVWMLGLPAGGVVPHVCVQSYMCSQYIYIYIYLYIYIYIYIFLFIYLYLYLYLYTHLTTLTLTVIYSKFMLYSSYSFVSCSSPSCRGPPVFVEGKLMEAIYLQRPFFNHHGTTLCRNVESPCKP